MSNAGRFTIDVILNMPYGQGMDALVAEKVMEWKRQPVKVECYEYFRNEFGTIKYIRNDVLPGLCWTPSRRISDAWDIVNKMKRSDYNLQMIEYAYNRTYATFIPDLDSDEWTEANGKYCTPLAICRAALLATMER
jgi:hypothetical protein